MTWFQVQSTGINHLLAGRYGLRAEGHALVYDEPRRLLSIGDRDRSLSIGKRRVAMVDIPSDPKGVFNLSHPLDNGASMSLGFFRAYVGIVRTFRKNEIPYTPNQEIEELIKGFSGSDIILDPEYTFDSARK